MQFDAKHMERRRQRKPEIALCQKDPCAVTTSTPRHPPHAVAISLSNERLAGLLWQIVVAGSDRDRRLARSNAIHNLSVRRISTGFRLFLGREAGMPIADTWLAYSPKNTICARSSSASSTRSASPPSHRASDRGRTMIGIARLSSIGCYPACRVYA